MKLTKKKAKELAIEKWEYIIDNDGIFDIYKLYDEIPELMNMHDCAYCEYYYHQNHGDCYKCPLGKNVKNPSNSHCSTPGEPYSIWYDNQNKESAQKVLDQIKNS